MSTSLRIVSLLVVSVLISPPLAGRRTHAAAQTDPVTLWTGQVEFVHRHNATVGDVIVRWTRQITMRFTVDNTRNVERKNVEMFHSLDAVWRDRRSGQIVSLHHLGYPRADARSVLPNEIEYNPNVMSVKTCDPELSAPANLPDNTFRLGVTATPGALMSFGPAAPVGPMQIRLGAVIKVEFPYDYRQPDFAPPEADVPQAVSLPPLPADARLLNPPLTPAKVKATLKRRPLALEYVRLDRDLVGTRDFCQDCRAVGGSKNLAASEVVRGGRRSVSYFIHANNQIRVLVEGEDMGAHFHTARFIRDWTVRLNRDRARTSNFAGSGRFRDDNLSGGSSWFDHPGELLPGAPSSWPREQYIQEFIVAVRQLPEFGAVYYLIIYDSEPNGYRVRMYPAQTITIDEWCRLKTSTARMPYRDEGTAGVPMDSAWQRVNR